MDPKPTPSGEKRNADTAFPSRTQPSTQSSSVTSPYMYMFETFRDELDAHHDRRERIIKASRDITAASKKIIFTLQRTRTIGHVTQSTANLPATKEYRTIQSLYRSLAPDLRGLHAFRYERQITGGTQEFLEAMLFRHYLTTGKLLPFRDAARLFLAFRPGPDEARPGLEEEEEEEEGGHGEAEAEGGHEGISPTPADYILALFDAVGEIMRFAITSLASLPAPAPAPAPTGGIDGATPATKTGEKTPATKTGEQTPATKTGEQKQTQTQDRILGDLLALRTALQTLDTANSSLGRDMGRKMEVMRECVEKVERVAYARVVRGCESPARWLPDLDTAALEL